MPKKPTAAPGTSLARWDERLAAMAKTAKQAVSKIGSGGQFLSLRGGIMTWQGAAIPENKLKVIVLDAIAENQYYEGSFDPEAFAAPTCYAFGRDPSVMAPDPEQVAEPFNPTCKGCPNNEWGSADVGKGKACKEVQRLALIPEGELDNIEEAEIGYLKVPVTSTKQWAGYVRQLDDVYHKPPLAFITEVAIVKENTNKLPGWHLEFRLVSAIDDPAAFEALFKRYDEVSKSIAFPYPKVEAAEEPAAAPARGNGRAAARKPAPRAAARAVPAAPVATAAVPAVGARRPVRAPKF